MNEKEQVISRSITINAPASVVWLALTDPDIMKRWISDEGIEVESEWKAGSSIIFKGNLHDVYFENSGFILQLLPEEVFEYSYLSNISGLEDKDENRSVVRFGLTEEKGQTVLNFRQTNFVALASYEHSKFYWSTALQVIKKLVESYQLHKL